MHIAGVCSFICSRPAESALLGIMSARFSIGAVKSKASTSSISAQRRALLCGQAMLIGSFRRPSGADARCCSRVAPMPFTVAPSATIAERQQI
jgi:hypothetical protein